jgi:hypothetical protein
MRTSFGSGRERSPRPTVGTYSPLRVFVLHHAGALTAGVTTRWAVGPGVIITVRAESTRVHISANGAPEVSVGISYVSGNLGGGYPLFVCPCGRRVWHLYEQGLRFACRCCLRLTYNSRYEVRADSVALRRARKLRSRLPGADPHPFGSVPERPCRARAARVYDELAVCEGRALAVLADINRALAARGDRND